ncbi:tetratricopeptide repeat protein [Paenibacillus sacheonensis]|uniref:Tetratricopeptide repeat protein n=1 Tax=Paenibacillus sacheonensis TaxID=742054 RepID=A0A7X4YS92_9BACL|nr:tetratricopeptide repeat protein [Paenibacillus sacheonensis]MBM7566985.1 tetratricopeptide (TPR) repeat protein [Paenibacillus sacheonensis]NBC71607.1 hypothetical protein [Paenibacillus sacheonensis]
MNKNRSPHFFVSIMIACMVFITSPGTGLAQSSSAGLEQDYGNKANRFIAAKNYEQAALVLEELLAKNPELKNETVYKQLTHIYDDYLFNFQKALSVYKKYLDRFPEGKFAGAFRERVAYLNERRSEWPALRDFGKVRLKEDNIPIKQSLVEVEAILSKNEDALIAPEMHIYLANNYFVSGDYRKASEHAGKYIKSFAKAGMSNTDKALALQLYSDILVKQHHYEKAIQSLDQAMALENPGENFNYALKKSHIITQRNMLYGFIICLLYFITVLMATKFWRRLHSQKFTGRLAAPLLLLALLSLGPALILNITEEPEVDPRFFFDLLGLSILSLMTIKLLAPLSSKTGRLVYVLMSCLHMGAASFMAYYITVFHGSRTMMNTVIEADIDPVAFLFRMLMWCSVAAALLITIAYAIIFSKKGADGGYSLPKPPSDRSLL